MSDLNREWLVNQESGEVHITYRNPETGVWFLPWQCSVGQIKNFITYTDKATLEMAHPKQNYCGTCIGEPDAAQG